MSYRRHLSPLWESSWLPIILCLLVSKPVQAQGPAEEVIADAYSLNGRLLYREHHRLEQDGLLHHVEYRSPEGLLLAHKALDYRHQPFAPDFTMSFTTHDLEYGAFWQQGESPSRLQLFNRNSKDSRDNKQRTQQVAVAGRSPLVLDGGINHFIKQHFDTLATGKAVNFHFGLSLRLATIKLKLQRVHAQQLPFALQDYDVPVETTAIFRAQASNWLVRQLAPEIFFIYDQPQERLILFYGPTNLLDKNGEAEQVVIRFRKPPLGPAQEKAALVAANRQVQEEREAL